MKIDDIIRKCIEIPGISIKRSDFQCRTTYESQRREGGDDLFPAFPWAYYCVYLRKFSDMGSTQFL